VERILSGRFSPLTTSLRSSRISARSAPFSAPLTYSGWYLKHTLMIHKSPEFVGQQIRQYSLRSNPSALARSQHGGRLTCFNSSMIKPRCSGIPHHVGCIKFLQTMSASAALMFCQFGRYVTSEYTLTPTWPWGSMLPPCRNTYMTRVGTMFDRQILTTHRIKTP